MSGPPADVLLAVRIPGVVVSEFVNTLLADNPDMTRAEAWRRNVQRILGGWPDVEIVGGDQ